MSISILCFSISAETRWWSIPGVFRQRKISSHLRKETKTTRKHGNSRSSKVESRSHSKTSAFRHHHIFFHLSSTFDCRLVQLASGKDQFTGEKSSLAATQITRAPPSVMTISCVVVFLVLSYFGVKIFRQNSMHDGVKLR